MTSKFGPHDRFKSKVTSCKQAWNIYLDTTCFKLVIFNFYFYLVICLLVYFYLVILLSVVIILYQVIFFVHGYMKSSQIQIFTGNQLKRSQTKQVLKSHILRNYVLKENSHAALPKSRCCPVIILSWFDKTKFVTETICVWFTCSHNNTILGLSKWRKHP